MKRRSTNRDFPRFLDALARIGDVPHSTRRIDRICCSGDASGSPFYHWRWKYKILPDVVIWPRDAADIGRVMKLASEHSIPVTPRGGGTCYVGSSVPTRGGILLDLKRLNGITLQPGGQVVTVQAGATFTTVQNHLHDHGLSLAAWPTSAAGATIGGWISTGGYVGFGTARHGGFREQVISLNLVRASGEEEHVVEPAGIGSYFSTCGTLAIIVSAGIKVVPAVKVTPFCFSFQTNEDLEATITALLSDDEKPSFIRFSNRSRDLRPSGDEDPSWLLLVIHDSAADRLTSLVEKNRGHYLGVDASRLHGDEVLVYETLPKTHTPVLMMQQVLTSLHDCFSLIDTSQDLADSLGFPMVFTGVVTSINCVRLIFETPADNELWTQFMAKKAMLHEIIKNTYKRGIGHVYTSGMLNALYMKRFERPVLLSWALEKKKADPSGILNPYKYGKSKMSYLRIDVLFAINVAWRRLALHSKKESSPHAENIQSTINSDSPLNTCAHCEACRDACPVYVVVGNEAASASGRNRVIETYERNAFVPDAELSSVLIACTTCGACKASCPIGIDHPAFVIEWRSQVDIVNEKHKAMRESFIKEGNVYGKPRDGRADWLHGDQVCQFHVVDHGDIAYFTGCTAAYRFQEIAISTLTILSRLVPEGIVVLGNEEMCCGGPIVRVGQDQRAGVKSRVQEMVQKLVHRGVKRVVFSCPGCYSAAVEYWPSLLEAELPFEALHVVEFVADAIRAGKVRFNEAAINATYHDPCHLGRQLGIYDAPREILTAIPGLCLVEMKNNRERAVCCGAGGGVRSSLPDLASTMAARRVDEARRTGASTVVTSCVFCAQALCKAIDESHNSMQCVDIVELLSASIVASNEGKKGDKI